MHLCKKRRLSSSCGGFLETSKLSPFFDQTSKIWTGSGQVLYRRRPPCTCRKNTSASTNTSWRGNSRDRGGRSGSRYLVVVHMRGTCGVHNSRVFPPFFVFPGPSALVSRGTRKCTITSPIPRLKRNNIESSSYRKDRRCRNSKNAMHTKR